MDPIAHLALATAVFLAIHVVPSTPLRSAAASAIGEGAYLGLFSLASLAGIVWMVWAYGQTPLTPLWPGPPAVMPLAFILLACGLMTPNPTVVAQGKLLAHADPARGIVRITRHPVMWAIMLWAGAHLLARGELKSTIFFGGFLLLAAAGTLLQDARKAKLHGEDWKRFAALTSNVPFVAIAAGRNRFVWSEIGLVRVVVGLILFGGFFTFHPWLFGARPY